jgi:hypothetical protein
MVIIPPSRSARQCGTFMTEMMVAIALLVGTLLPIAYSVASERRQARFSYQRAVAMEIVDGEMEILVAGGWRAFAPGRHALPVNAAAATNLPPGQLLLTVETNRVRLEWQPGVKHMGGPVAREAVVK